MTSTNPIDEYIERQDPARKDNLCAVRDTIRKELPGAEERISWSMPTWWKGITSSISRRQRSISASIRDLGQWSILRTNSRNAA